MSSVSRIIGSSSGTGTKAETTNARSKSENKTSDATYSPALARTPQSTNSPSASSAPHRSVSQSRAERTATQHPAKTAAIGSGTAKKISSHSKKNDYNSSPTPSVGAGTPAAYGLGISTSTSKESPSFKQHGYASNASKGKTPAHDVEEFDMGSNSDEDLLSNSLQLPPSRTSIMANSSRSQSTHASTGLQGHAGQGQPTRQPGPASGSTSLSMFSNQDMVMSEISSEDENDFDDLANDLESSLVGQGPFARASISNFGGGGANRDIVSSDEDEDEEEDEDFENALSEQTKVPAPQPQMSRPTIQSIPPIQQPQPHVQQPLPHRIGQIPQQPAARPVQAGKKLPSAPRRYDSDIASSSESDDDSD